MITKKIRSLKDQTLDTTVDHKLLVRGEVAVIQFINQIQVDSYISVGILELVEETEPVRKVIPVIGDRRPVDDVMKREIEVKIEFDPSFRLEEHLTNGV